LFAGCEVVGEVWCARKETERRRRRREKRQKEEQEEEGDRSHASEEHKQSAVVFLSFPTGRTW
jgi:hypothetical protein